MWRERGAGLSRGDLKKGRPKKERKKERKRKFGREGKWRIERVSSHEVSVAVPLAAEKGLFAMTSYEGLTLCAH